jgi:hypothetical protein
MAVACFISCATDPRECAAGFTGEMVSVRERLVITLTSGRELQERVGQPGTVQSLE